MQRAFRMFTAGVDDDSWTELTAGDGPVVRIRATDLQRARRERCRLRSDRDVAVVLDIRVLIAGDFRAARHRMTTAGGPATDCVQYVGTVSGLAGLIRDVCATEVADGVTLVAITPEQDVRALALATLAASGLDGVRPARALRTHQ